MNKTTIIYSLSTRGLYSELFNLCLAKVYAQNKRLSLRLNTYLWNSRIKKGWQDYFEPTLECSNNPLPAQDKVYSNEKPWIGKVYYNPHAFFSYYIRLFLNKLYLILHPTHLLTREIFNGMRSVEFIHDALGKDAFNLMAISFKQMYIINNETKLLIRERTVSLELPDSYIGVHIRRGDKITSQEMQNIHLDKYVNAMVAYKNISPNVYIATDDISIISYIKKRTENQNITIYYNFLNHSQGFNEQNFNHSSLKTRKEDTLNVLLDMDILIHSKFFIGTYTSNLSRVVPFFIGPDKCLSLDNDWNIINSLNGL